MRFRARWPDGSSARSFGRPIIAPFLMTP